jgi:hypothetical protein
VQARRITADRTLGPILDVSAFDETAYPPLVALDAAGTATVVWERTDSDNPMIKARRIAPDGSLGPILDLTAPNETAYLPAVAVDSAGVATAVWQLEASAGNVLQARRIAADGTLSPTQDLFPPGDATAANVVVDAAGTATVVGEHRTKTTVVLEARRIAPDGTLQPIRNVSAPIASKSGVLPHVAAVGDGATIVVWERFIGGKVVITARPLAPDGTPGRIRQWPTGSGSGLGPQVAVDGAPGGAVVVWHNGRGGAASTGTIQARRIAPNGSLGAIRDMSGSGLQVYDPQVSVGAHVAVAVWTHNEGSGTTVQGQRFRYR